MATFAKIDENNAVIQVVSVHNNVITDENAVEQESLGIEFLKNLYNEPNAKWLQTSYNTAAGIHRLGGTPFRMNHASLGGSYDPVKDIFIGTKPFSNYVGPNDKGLWDPPIPFPSIESYTDENGDEQFWQIIFDNDNIRWLGSEVKENLSSDSEVKGWLGSEVKENLSFDFVWNESNSSWDSLI